MKRHEVWWVNFDPSIGGERHLMSGGGDQRPNKLRITVTMATIMGRAMLSSTTRLTGKLKSWRSMDMVEEAKRI